ncbi:MAG: abscisic acid-deficient protein Aba4 family protein [Steroidobacteraceae bacterium]
MSLEQVFSIAGGVAMIGWLVLLLAPAGSAWPGRVVYSAAVALAMLYAALIGAYFSRSQGGFGSLADVAVLFATPGVLLAGWVHYLVFDLLVGSWERSEADRLALSRFVLAPCLLLTFLLGPLGWLLFLAVRHVRMRAQLVRGSSPA